MDFKQLRTYTKDLSILYVEDDSSVASYTAEILYLLFANVTVAKNGKEGLLFYKSYFYEKNQGYDIVLTDLHMPHLDGIKMIESILEIVSYQHICVISAQNDASKLLRLINLGIDSFLLKPIHEKNLIATLYKIATNIHHEKIALQYQAKVKASNEYLELEVQKRTRELQRQLYLDHLTGLNNRIALNRDLEKEQYTLLALVDIDRLQFINDLYGVEIGSDIIRKFSNILKQYLSKDYTLYRTSGDEFAICARYEDKEQFISFIASVSEGVTHLPLFIESLEEEIFIDATIGVSYDNTHLLTHADLALKYAKSNQKPFVVYNDSMNMLDKMQDVLVWKRKIETAIQNDDIIPVFQPIVNANGEIVKYETLMRLRDGDKLVSPYFFLETAIQTKLYPKLSMRIVKKALDFLISSDVTLSVNLSYSDFSDQRLIAMMTEVLERENIGSRLVFEILESEDIKDYKMVQRFILKFRRYGVKIAIDDFGSGFSNFGNIMQTKPDFIKIDGSLVKNIHKDKLSQSIVKAITQVSKEMGVKVIAEFVHSKEVFEKLQQLDIEEYQGYYFFEPSLSLMVEENMI